MSDVYKTISMDSKIEKLTIKLKEEYKLSNYQALNIALKVERNEILSRAFVIDNSDTITALERLVLAIEQKLL